MPPPPVVYSTLCNYLNRFRNIRSSEPEDNNLDPELLAARFALTGITPDDSELVAVDINPDLLGASERDPFVRRDIDSVLGYTEENPVRDAIHYFPYPNLSRTLERSVHIKHSVMIDDEWTSYEPSTVPNVHFGHFGHRHSIRLFFPHLKSDDRTSVRLQGEELEALYNLGIRPAAENTLARCVHDWPGSFSTAEWKDRNASSGFSYSSVVIPADSIQEFSTELRFLADTEEQLAWARDFFWGVEIRGVKDMCSHPITATREEKARLLNLVLHQVDTRHGTWYADVALEFMQAGQALIWTTVGHQRLMEHLLGMDPEDAARYASGRNTRYARDTSTHILALSGFRADFSAEATGGVGHNFVAYAQGYMTDKQQTYHPEGGKYSKTLTVKLAVIGNPPGWCQSGLRVMGDAADKVDVATRFEKRLPLVCVEDAFSQVDMTVVKDCMVCYKRELWWDFRSSKLWAATLLLSCVNSDTLQVRMLEQSLMLVAGLVYQVNCLLSRPDDGSQARRIQKAIYPLTSDRESPYLLVKNLTIEREAEDYPSGIPYAPGGMLYLRDIVLKPSSVIYQFHLPSYLRLPDAAFKYAFGCLRPDVTRFLFKAGVTQRARFVGYVPQRKGFTKARAAPENEMTERSFPAFNDDVQNVVVMNDEGDEVQADQINLRERLDNLIQQFASDLLQKLGNPVDKTKGITCYSSLSQPARQKIGIHDVNTLSLGGMFNQLQWRRATPEEWERSVRHLLPPSSHCVTMSTYHFPGCRYFELYKELMQALEPAKGKECRKALMAVLRDLAWLPATRSDRLWLYDVLDESWNRVPCENLGGPRLYVNPVAGGRIDVTNHTAQDLVALRQVEERQRVDGLREEQEESSAGGGGSSTRGTPAFPAVNEGRVPHQPLRASLPRAIALAHAQRDPRHSNGPSRSPSTQSATYRAPTHEPAVSREINVGKKRQLTPDPRLAGVEIDWEKLGFATGAQDEDLVTVKSLPSRSTSQESGSRSSHVKKQRLLKDFWNNSIPEGQPPVRLAGPKPRTAMKRNTMLEDEDWAFMANSTGTSGKKDNRVEASVKEEEQSFVGLNFIDLTISPPKPTRPRPATPASQNEAIVLTDSDEEERIRSLRQEEEESSD
ncbi:hypothetical protein CPB83DRAFT_899623 [Crepidotus variabilis]|uniref:Uncharacterized protein n=1 Tax=Crepidotus variabilis TaxID=179855 RepID=A0A9P6E4M8_9AGAR|nr:hypothetical protein CPB83DRAFT_899623 [Crepidotus variabilis]